VTGLLILPPVSDVFLAYLENCDRRVQLILSVWHLTLGLEVVMTVLGYYYPEGLPFPKLVGMRWLSSMSLPLLLLFDHQGPAHVSQS
jgi:hypothetical protein